jgi:hypothetical protein
MPEVNGLEGVAKELAAKANTVVAIKKIFFIRFSLV